MSKVPLSKVSSGKIFSRGYTSCGPWIHVHVASLCHPVFIAVTTCATCASYIKVSMNIPTCARVATSFLGYVFIEEAKYWQI